jgi:Mg/Co/Ni transporter MgtE
LLDAPFDDAVMLLSRMRRERRIALIESIEDRARKRELLRHEQYPANTAGALLQDTFLRIDVNDSLAAVVEDLSDLHRDDLPLLVVVDSAGRYVGILNPWLLIGRRLPARTLAELADQIPPISPETPASGAAAHTAWLEHNMLPVVDTEQRVLGALSRNAVMHAAGQDAANGAGPANLALDLLGGLTRVLSDLLEGILARRAT